MPLLLLSPAFDIVTLLAFDFLMLPALFAVCALGGVFFLSRLVANARVAAAAALCVALYPVFVAEAAAVLPVASVTALTNWGLFFYFKSVYAERFARAVAMRGLALTLFAAACVVSQTAVIVPAILCVWELLGRATRGARAGTGHSVAFPVFGRGREAALALALLLAPALLVALRLFGIERAGSISDDVGGARAWDASGAVSYLAAVLGHLKHFTIHEGLWALTLSGAAAMFLRPRHDGGTERPRIAVPVQLTFAALVLAHVLFLPLLGASGAWAALPVLPPVILIWVSTLWRRVPLWALIVALVCALFLLYIG